MPVPLAWDQSCVHVWSSRPWPRAYCDLFASIKLNRCNSSGRARRNRALYGISCGARDGTRGDSIRQGKATGSDLDATTLKGQACASQRDTRNVPFGQPVALTAGQEVQRPDRGPAVGSQPSSRPSPQGSASWPAWADRTSHRTPLACRGNSGIWSRCHLRDVWCRK
jgi:hypothetical protein